MPVALLDYATPRFQASSSNVFPAHRVWLSTGALQSTHHMTVWLARAGQSCDMEKMNYYTALCLGTRLRAAKLVNRPSARALGIAEANHRRYYFSRPEYACYYTPLH